MTKSMYYKWGKFSLSLSLSLSLQTFYMYLLLSCVWFTWVNLVNLVYMYVTKAKFSELVTAINTLLHYTMYIHYIISSPLTRIYANFNLYLL